MSAFVYTPSCIKTGLLCVGMLLNTATVCTYHINSITKKWVSSVCCLDKSKVTEQQRYRTALYTVAR